ncbi:TPA: sugar ABC transporter permease, partial [Serratia liquefaciens]|nr:sugar ABC transporter permease [Serratia liquefaciens]
TLSFFVYQESFSYLRAGSGAAYGVLIALYMLMLFRQRRRSLADEA